MNDIQNTERPTRPLGVAHLIFGLIFTGIAATWIIGKANDTDVPDFAIGLPIVLIGAGIVGLAASVLNQRRTRARLVERRTSGAVTSESLVEETAPLTTSTENEDLS